MKQQIPQRLIFLLLQLGLLSGMLLLLLCTPSPAGGAQWHAAAAHLTALPLQQPGNWLWGRLLLAASTKERRVPPCYCLLSYVGFRCLTRGLPWWHLQDSYGFELRCMPAQPESKDLFFDP